MKAVILVVGLLVVVACIVAGVVFLRRGRELEQESSKASPRLSRSPNPGVKEAPPKPKKAWAVYVIDHPANVPLCDAVKKLHFRHFGQSQQLPTLPLKDCDKKDTCQCFHREIMEKRRAQRRVGRDRREEFRFEQSKASKPERRVLKDRRASRTDWDGYDTDR